MTIYDVDKREKCCPSCKQERLIFIVTAPNLWPRGDDVRYRCKPCAIQEAEAAGEALAVFQHRERSHLAHAWKHERMPSPAHLADHSFAKSTPRQGVNPASDAKGDRIHLAPQNPRRNTAREEATP